MTTPPVSQPLRVYVTALWNAEKVIARKLGSQDIRRAPIELRVGLIMLNLVLGCLLQILVEKGITTDADIQTRMTALTSAPLKRQPDNVPPDNEESGVLAPDPDLGV
jgi:hypothetical protein